VVPRLCAFASCPCPIAGRALAVVGCFRSIGRRPISVSLGPQKNILATGVGVVVEVVETREFIATGGAAIAKVTRPVAVIRRP
jgi:hypothetical protein